MAAVDGVFAFLVVFLLLSARVSVGRTPSPLLRWVRAGDVAAQPRVRGIAQPACPAAPNVIRVRYEVRCRVGRAAFPELLDGVPAALSRERPFRLPRVLLWVVYPLHTEPPMLRGPEDGIYAFDLVLLIIYTLTQILEPDLELDNQYLS